MNGPEARIPIVEDCDGAAYMHAELLSADYMVEVVHSGAEVQSLIDQKGRLDPMIIRFQYPPASEPKS